MRERMITMAGCFKEEEKMFLLFGEMKGKRGFGVIKALFCKQ
jgi:hypothetical protein